jgi:hypothetical protein
MGANFSRKAGRFPCVLDVEGHAQADGWRNILVTLSDHRSADISHYRVSRWNELVQGQLGVSATRTGRFRPLQQRRRGLQGGGSGRSSWCFGLEENDDGLRKRIMEALTTVAMGTIKGTIGGWRPHDAKEHALYCSAVTELANCLKGQDNMDGSSG